MYFKELELKNFRNYDHQSVKFHEKVNIIIGNNAQGKTNLLESLFVTSLGKSFRTNNDGDMILFGKDAAKVKAVSVRDDWDITVELTFFSGRKEIRIDGDKKKKNIELLENNYIVIFSPEDLKIVKDEPEKRRRFIDREICQLKPVYYRNLVRYKKILSHRNALLKQERIDENSLFIWNDELVEYGSRVMMDRLDFINKLNIISKEIHKNITAGNEELNLYYGADIDIKETLDDQKRVFSDKLSSRRGLDLTRRTTTCGPHKDDLKIFINDIDIRSFGSQGQQRTAALSLKLAELNLIFEETGVKPVLLLDDVLSELDISRQKFLINSFKDVQIFITTTEIQDILNDSISDCYIFSIENGHISNIDVK